MTALTVSTYLQRIRIKTGSKNLANLVSWAYQTGILKVKEYEPSGTV
jgi:DNA-binding CsgD family transcriptional regulator